jgi:hypothetical protein
MAGDNWHIQIDDHQIELGYFVKSFEQTHSVIGTGEFIKLTIGHKLFKMLSDNEDVNLIIIDNGDVAVFFHHFGRAKVMVLALQINDNNQSQPLGIEQHLFRIIIVRGNALLPILHDPPEGIFKFNNIDRLPEKALYRHGVGVHYRFFIFSRTEKQEGYTLERQLLILVDLGAQLETIHPGHIDVGENKERYLIGGIQVLERIGSIQEKLKIVSKVQVLKYLDEDALVCKVIFYDYNRAGFVHLLYKERLREGVLLRNREKKTPG